jgi:cobalamin biosynthesis Mg chelatase CobN
MKKFILIFASLFFIGCGSVKKEKLSIDTEKEKETETNSSSNTARWINSSNFTLEPADPLQPMTFTNAKGEKETYTNTIIKNNNTHTKEIVHDSIAKKEKEKEKTEIDKSTKEKDNTMVILIGFGMVLVFLLLVIVFLAWWFGKKINTIMQMLPKNT